MNTLQVLMPMGGLGSRFTKEGYTTPKALIEVDGKPMFMRALDSFNHIQDIQHIFVIRKEHDEIYNLSKEIHHQLPGAKIAILDHNTEGAVETCLIANDLIDDDLPLVVADCDIYFESDDYFEKITRHNTEQLIDAMLLTFYSDDPRYSYAKLDDNGSVVKTAEKIVISNNAILGGYFFRTGSLFKHLANTFMNTGLENGLKEYYMSHLFNILLSEGGKIEIAEVDVKHIFGTPEELNSYLALH